jgi:CcmD family protein
MEYLVIAYTLIALVLVGYTLHLHQRMANIERERALLETKKE